jgi:hypothetical protein
MEPIKKNFKDCDREFLEETFLLVQTEKQDPLTSWIEKSRTYQLTPLESEITVRYQETLIYRVDDWNEQELIEHFIGPLFALINFNTKEFGMFSERFLGARIGDYELSGNPDAIVAKGRRSPKIPYFCFHEYKKEQENKGDPAGQCLAAMLVAQALNNNSRPIYGITVKGEKWQFMVLKGKEYAISNSYISTDEELYDIVKLLKHLKTIIEEFVKS